MALCPQGPHREGEEPKPMMHADGTSDAAIVAGKPANKAERSAAEPVERRAATKGNAEQQRTCRTPSRAGVTQTLGRIRRTARWPQDASPLLTRGRSRMRESRTYGSARGALSNERPYRDRRISGAPTIAPVAMLGCGSVGSKMAMHL